MCFSIFFPRRSGFFLQFLDGPVVIPKLRLHHECPTPWHLTKLSIRYQPGSPWTHPEVVVNSGAVWVVKCLLVVSEWSTGCLNRLMSSKCGEIWWEYDSIVQPFWEWTQDMVHPLQRWNSFVLYFLSFVISRPQKMVRCLLYDRLLEEETHAPNRWPSLTNKLSNQKWKIKETQNSNSFCQQASKSILPSAEVSASSKSNCIFLIWFCMAFCFVRIIMVSSYDATLKVSWRWNGWMAAVTISGMCWDIAANTVQQDFEWAKYRSLPLSIAISRRCVESHCFPLFVLSKQGIELIRTTYLVHLYLALTCWKLRGSNWFVRLSSNQELIIKWLPFLFDWAFLKSALHLEFVFHLCSCSPYGFNQFEVSVIEISEKVQAKHIHPIFSLFSWIHSTMMSKWAKKTLRSKATTKHQSIGSKVGIFQSKSTFGRGSPPNLHQHTIDNSDDSKAHGDFVNQKENHEPLLRIGFTARDFLRWNGILVGVVNCFFWGGGSIF